MNATDYRIQTRKDLLRGVVLGTRMWGGVPYARIRLSDGRVLSSVRYAGTVLTGARVLVRYDAGYWRVEA